MITITEISPQQKGRLLNVFADGKFSFSADEGFIADEDIYVGMKLDEKQMAALLKAAGIRKAVRASLSLLERRDYSVKELTKKLVEKGHGEEEAAAAAERAEAAGYVNDRRYGERLVERRKNRVGRKQLAYELAKAGISADEAKDIISETYDDETDGVETVLREMNRRLKGSVPADRAAQRKLFNSFISKGFEFETVKAAFEKYCENEDRSVD